MKYESLKEEVRKFGKNSYVEVTRKRLVNGRGREEAQFVLVARGFYDETGGKKWTRFVTLPAEPEVTEWLAKALKRV